TITLNGEDTSFTPEIVRCNGEPGTIRNAVLTMEDDELPLVKVNPGEFAMVKLDNHGEPEKSSSTKGITAEDGEITFDDASIGDATVDGTVTCLQGNQGWSPGAELGAGGTGDRRRPPLSLSAAAPGVIARSPFLVRW